MKLTPESECRLRATKTPVYPVPLLNGAFHPRVTFIDTDAGYAIISQPPDAPYDLHGNWSLQFSFKAGGLAAADEALVECREPGEPWPSEATP